MQLNLNVPFVDLSGKPVPNLEQTLGQIVATTIVQTSKGNVLKIYGWGQKLTANEPIELDKADEAVFKSIIDDNDQMTILLKGQVLTILSESCSGKN